MTGDPQKYKFTVDKKDGEEEDQYDAMGNKVDTKKTKKITSSEARKVRYQGSC